VLKARGRYTSRNTASCILSTHPQTSVGQTDMVGCAVDRFHGPSAAGYDRAHAAVGTLGGVRQQGATTLELG
jgi:hypothetical protein